MKHLPETTGIALGIFCLASNANAQAQVIAIEVFPGHGTTINFRTTGSTVRKAWIDDPSKVTLDFDDAACLNAESDRPCNANVIHLRRIHPLYFPGLPTTTTTGLTVVTDRDIYQFRLSFPKSGTPKNPTISVQASPQPAIKPSNVQQIERGLQVATSKQLIAPGDALWKRIQLLLALARNGIPVVNAAQQVGISQQLLQRLIDMGQQITSL